MVNILSNNIVIKFPLRATILAFTALWTMSNTNNHEATRTTYNSVKPQGTKGHQVFTLTDPNLHLFFVHSYLKSFTMEVLEEPDYKGRTYNDRFKNVPQPKVPQIKPGTRLRPVVQVWWKGREADIVTLMVHITQSLWYACGCWYGGVSRSMFVYTEGFWPEWCISTTYAWDTPF